VRVSVFECVRGACMRACVRACVQAYMGAYVRACMRACVRACARACVRACVRAKGRTYMSGGVHKPYQFQYCARVERLVCFVIANITKKRHFFCQTLCSQHGLAQCSSTAVLRRKEHRATHTI